jgi:hypothetical protein
MNSTPAWVTSQIAARRVHTGCDILGCLTVPSTRTVTFKSGQTAKLCDRCAATMTAQGQLR